MQKLVSTFRKTQYDKWLTGSFQNSKTNLFNWVRFRITTVKILKNLDPYRTGYITKEEFCQILKEIEPRLEDTDLDEISVAFGEQA